MITGIKTYLYRKPVRAFVIFAVFATVLLTSNFIYGLLTSTTTIGSHGSVKAIGVRVYWDSSCTNEVSSIDWGVIEPGSYTNVTVYVKNTGNSDATLTLSTENWSPSNASNYMTLTWNYDGQSIEPNDVIQVELTLAVASNITGITDFSFDIVIIGSG